MKQSAKKKTEFHPIDVTRVAQNDLLAWLTDVLHYICLALLLLNITEMATIIGHQSFFRRYPMVQSELNIHGHRPACIMSAGERESERKRKKKKTEGKRELRGKN